MAGAVPTGCAERYRKTAHLGRGTFGEVFKAEDVVTGAQIAIKKIKIGNRAEAEEGLNRTALREIKCLQELHHPNVIELVDVYGKFGNLHLVFELCATDLDIIIRDRQIAIQTPDVKSYLLMLLQGLEYMHQNWVLHRDLKPNNLFITARGVLKIADFGLATFYGSASRDYTCQVVTIWYRAPELL